MGTKNCPGDFDCYANAMDDEPIFVLLARDHRAAPLVRKWAMRHRDERVARGGENYAMNSKEQEAMDCAEAMDAWRAANRP